MLVMPMTVSAAGPELNLTLESQEITTSTTDTDVTLTVELSTGINIAGYEFDCVVPDGFQITSITNDDAGVGGSLDEAFYNLENGRVRWLDIGLQDRMVQKLGELVIRVPAGTEAGQYPIYIRKTGAYSTKGTVTEFSQEEAEVTLTVKEASVTPDPDPNPNPDPTPTPDPDPNPNPDPTPTPDPDPNPNPDPTPTPDPDPTPAGLPFTDVAESDWFYESVAYAYYNGLFQGVTETTFEPDTSMSRAMIVTVLYRLEGSPTAGASGFSDVASGSWYADAVAWASARGVVQGMGDGTFRPDDPLTREQIAAILYRYYEGNYSAGSLAQFNDVDSVSDWAKDALGWCVDRGIISGLPGSILSPQGNATRAQVAAMLMRAQG